MFKNYLFEFKININLYTQNMIVLAKFSFEIKKKNFGETFTLLRKHTTALSAFPLTTPLSEFKKHSSGRMKYFPQMQSCTCCLWMLAIAEMPANLCILQRLQRCGVWKPLLRSDTRKRLSSGVRTASFLCLGLLSGLLASLVGVPGVRLVCATGRGTLPLLLGQFSPEQLLWHSWVLSESIRRTWCVSMGLQSGYELQKTESGPCSGTLPITTRKGLWEARSAFAWTKMCAESNIGFMCRNDHEKVMVDMEPGHIDDFALCMMELDIGPDRMARWRSERSGWHERNQRISDQPLDKT